MRDVFRPALTLFLLMSLLLGAAYPALITAAAQGLFPRQANGSLIRKDDKILGSRLIGQNFSDPKYFWGRLSATPSFATNAANSGDSNLSAANPALTEAVQNRVSQLKKTDPKNANPIPVDLATSSGSGLDPDISPAAAAWQISRVAKARDISEDEVRSLVAQHTEPRSLGFLGEERVNVLLLNLAMDGKL